MSGISRSNYRQLKYWVDNYGSAGVTDQKAVHTFMECENRETITALRNELVGVSQANFDEPSMDRLIKPKRRIMHNSYQEWGKLMLLWMAEYKG